jgi:protein-tyrosine phosphatase
MINREELSEQLKAKVANGEKIKVLFVCLGNICRSPAGEAVMLEVVKELGMSDCWEIDSAGTGDYHIGDLADPRMRQHAAKRGIRLLHRCRQVRSTDFDYFDIILAMDDSNRRNLLNLSPTVDTDAKILPISAFFTAGPLAPAAEAVAEYTPKSLSNKGVASKAAAYDATIGYDYVPDPYYSGAEGFELVLDMLAIACRNLALLLR